MTNPFKCLVTTIVLSAILVFGVSSSAFAGKRLPDGGTAKSSSGNIKQAWYEDPTTRYGHGILGDAIEAGSLAVKDAKGRTLRFTLPRSQVFEDITPRLADLDRNGTTEVITILSSTTKGGSVAVFGVRGNTLVKLAQTPYIGRSNRWLNIAGIANYKGGSKLEIAAVITPHIGGTLRFWEYASNKLRTVGSMGGFSNHFIGSRAQQLSATMDFDGDGKLDLAVPSADRRKLRIVGFKKGRIKELYSETLPAKVSGDFSQRNGAMQIPLSNGMTYALAR